MAAIPLVFLGAELVEWALLALTGGMYASYFIVLLYKHTFTDLYFHTAAAAAVVTHKMSKSNSDKWGKSCINSASSSGVYKQEKKIIYLFISLIYLFIYLFIYL